MSKALRSAVVAGAMNLGAGTAHATLVETNDGSGDQVNWGQLGPVNASVSSGTAFTTGGGVTGTVTFADTQNGPGTVMAQDISWYGNFNSNQSVLWSNNFSFYFAGGVGLAPVTLTFDTPVSSFTEAIQADYYGAFTAQIDVYNGATLLGSFTQDGVSDNTPGTAIFLGVLDDVAEITSVVYSVTSCSLNCSDFALGGSTFRDTTSTPEPVTLSLFGAGLAGLGAIRRRRKSA